MTFFKYDNHDTPRNYQERSIRSKRQSSCLTGFVFLNLLLSPTSSTGFVIGQRTTHPCNSMETQYTRKSMHQLYQFSTAEMIEHKQEFYKTQRRMKTICLAQKSHSSGKTPNDNDDDSSSPTIPTHIAFICDGNSRWAKTRFLPTAAGHAAGANTLINTLQSLKQVGVAYCTFYGFSTENWKRPPEEIREIFVVMEQTARQFYHQAVQERVQVKILGDIDDQRIPTELRDSLRKLERDTAAIPDSKLSVCIAVNYGGRRDIINAAMKLSELSSQLQDSDSWENDSEELFSSLLCTHGIPDPEMIIRTGGERRLSNFLLWNTAYSELYFVDDLWPDFDKKCLDLALKWYSNRCRRFGGREDSDMTSHTPAANGFVAKG